MPDLNQLYEDELLKEIIGSNRAIKKIYVDAINEISFDIKTIKYKGKQFSLSEYPNLKNKVEKVLKGMNTEIYGVTVNSIESTWALANKKNNLLIDKRLAGKIPAKSSRKILYDPNKPALNAFLDRKEAGLKLSNRVWNNLQPFRKELEQSLGFSISNGESAAETATKIKKYLNEPDKLFRRVRSEEGKLTLSQQARNYHPGKGIYRSSYKNALRLVRTETNMAYRTADHQRWNSLPFVIGMEVKLSDAHPRYDICDMLAGKYPKEFLFRGWHPQCLCHAIPIMASDAEYNKIEDAILNGDPIPKNIGGRITKPPAALNKWVKDNKERIAGWQNTPYWMKDNKQFLK